jgi:hypothetical protein
MICFSKYKHLDIIEIYDTIEWNKFLIVDIKNKNGKIKRHLFNLDYGGIESIEEYHKHMNDNCIRFIKNLKDIKVENTNG